MTLFACAIFLSAFLLFLVQPVVAKMIVPWFGGSASVWTTCLLFFQLILLLGYGYAHWLVKKLSPRLQSRVHGALILLSVLWLPLGPAVSLKPTGTEEPMARILLVLAATVGLPYFLLSTTGPLIQAWSARRTALPYRLYALSNLASLLALVAYPFVIEPAITLRHQSWIWTAMYAVWGGVTIWLAYSVQNEAAPEPSEELAPSWLDQVIWASLAFFPSALLLAVSNHLSQNVAAIPFLWVLPLAIYLLSFVLTFDTRLYHTQVFRWLLAVALAAGGYYMVHEDADAKLKVLLPSFLVGLFVACMYGHGELAKRKPAPAYLTSFYLMLSLGGALGGLAVSIGAPLLLRGNYELPIMLTLFAGLVALLATQDNWIVATAWGALAIYLAVATNVYIRTTELESLVVTRNFFGTMRVRESGGPVEGGMLHRILIHGTINHGEQFFGSSLETSPTTYYGLDSGAGLALTKSRMPVHPNLKFGVVGLGVGTLANYGKKGDTLRFYEINPRVVEIAREQFTYLKNAKANIEIVMGDARLSMEREPPQGYDVLAVDAFSSDSIPIHLLTKEAVALMLRHLGPRGILAIHISNKHLNLDPVVHRIGQELGWTVLTVENEENQAMNVFSSDWVLVTKWQEFVNDPEVQRASIWKKRTDVLWTDDYSNLLRVLK